MKKIIIIALMLVASTFANQKYNFFIEIGKHNCEVISWKENAYRDGIFYKKLTEVMCRSIKELPLNISGMQFIDIQEGTFSNIYEYYYGEK